MTDTVVMPVDVALPGALELRRPNKWWALPAAAVAVMASYAVIVPAGLPYDEPSHWQNVRYIAAHGALPVLGSPRTSYEAQMGPVAYVIDAAVFRLAGLVGLNDAHAFTAVRLTGILWMLAFSLLTYRIVRRCLPALTPTLCAAGTALATLNPVVMSVGMSIQNDLPALTFALLALDLSGRFDLLSERRVIAIGAVAGLAVLTKLTVWPVLVVIAVFLLIRRRNVAGLRAVTLFGGAVALVLGWWVIRNLVLYGDLSGQAGVEALGTHFPPEGWHGAGTGSSLAQSAVTFLWLPVEYWRNTISAPPLVQAGVIGCTLLIGAFGSVQVWRLRSVSASPIVTVAAVSVLTWAIVDTWAQVASFRLAYLALPLWACASAGALRWLPRVGAATLAMLVLVGLHAWALFALLQLGHLPGIGLL